MIHKISAGVGERMQYITHKYNDTTIRFVLNYPGHLDPRILCAATQAVIGSVDVLHASFIAKTNFAYWRVNTEYEVSTNFDISGKQTLLEQFKNSYFHKIVELCRALYNEYTLCNARFSLGRRFRIK